MLKEEYREQAEASDSGSSTPPVEQPQEREREQYDADSEKAAGQVCEKSRRPPRELFQSDYMKRLLHYHSLAVVTIPAVGFLAALVLAATDGVGMPEIVALVVGYTFTFIGVEVGYHRYFAHKSFQAKPVLRLSLAILGSMAAQGPIIYWSSVHRHHHAYSDREGDIHSPSLAGKGLLSSIKGLIHAHMGWMFDHQIPNAGFYVRDLLQDKMICRVNRHYYGCILAGLLIPALAGWAATGTAIGAFKVFLWGGLVRLFLVDHFTWSVNSICHFFGSRRFATRDDSKNNIWLAIPTFGQSWHNNHHAFPWSAKVGLRWSEIDLGTLTIRIFQILGLASQVKAPTAAMVQDKQLEISRAGEQNQFSFPW